MRLSGSRKRGARRGAPLMPGIDRTRDERIHMLALVIGHNLNSPERLAARDSWIFDKIHNRTATDHVTRHETGGRAVADDDRHDRARFARGDKPVLRKKTAEIGDVCCQSPPGGPPLPPL